MESGKVRKAYEISYIGSIYNKTSFSETTKHRALTLVGARLSYTLINSHSQSGTGPNGTLI